MTKTEKAEHDQRLINSYNRQLNETERLMSKSDAYTAMLLARRANTIKNKLMKLYSTSKYGLV